MSGAAVVRRLWRHRFSLLAAMVVLVSVGGVQHLWRSVSSIEAALPLDSLSRERDFSALLLDIGNLEAALALAVERPSPEMLGRLGFRLDVAVLRHRDNSTLYGASGFPGLDEIHRNLTAELTGLDRSLRQAPIDTARLAGHRDHIGALKVAIKRLSDTLFQQSMAQATNQRAHLAGLRRTMSSVIVLFGTFGLGLVVLLLKQQNSIRAMERRDRELLTARNAALALAGQLGEQSKALVRSNAELEQFAYAASHDLRQPLRMVSSYMQLLERSLGDRLGEDERTFVAFARDGARRMDAMILSLLEYSRIGRTGQPMEWFDSRPALDEALTFLDPAIAECGGQVTVSGDWPRLFATRDEIVRLFLNLVGNALKYRVPGRAPKVDVVAVSTPGGWRFQVSDNGIGIEPDQIERLFGVFQRLHPQDRYEGTGVGLALCRKIVERHGGTIRASSAGAEQGATFVVDLPVQPE